MNDEIRSFTARLERIGKYQSKSDLRLEYLDILNRHCGLDCLISDFLDDEVAQGLVDSLIKQLRDDECSFCENRSTEGSGTYHLLHDWLARIPDETLLLTVGMVHRLGVLKIQRSAFDGTFDFGQLYQCAVEDLILSSFDVRRWCAVEFDYYGLTGNHVKEGILTIRFKA